MTKMTNDTYDALQKVIRLVIPLVTFLTAIGEIWGLSWMSLVTATISAFGIFLGSVLDASSKNYKKEKELKEKAEVPIDEE